MILLLEDEPLIAYALESELQAVAVNVFTVHTCQDALDVLAKSSVDAAILDFQIGDEDCTEVAEACEKKNIPYLVTSGYDVN